MVKLIALIIPLGLDTFVVSTAVGASGLPARHRLRVALIFTLFEGAMPLVGLALGASLSRAIGSTADYLAIAMLVASACTSCCARTRRARPRRSAN